jgi:calcineurin-like phosphoesterase family protein
MTKRTIRRRVFMGDSLSDRGTLDHLKLLDFIPMSHLSGLSKKSPRGRFTNGFLWVDMLGAAGSEQLEIDHWRHKLKLPKTAAASADIADRILSDSKLVEQNRRAFTLDDDRNILYQGARYIRSYCEGGATSADWKDKVTLNPGNEGARLVVSNLTAKRKQLFADDFKYKVSNQEKEETLITEWSGANDLITVNDKPTKESADKAIAARVANLEALIRNGYKNFVLMNLPDLGLTPRYKAKSPEEQRNATECSTYFNQQLAAQVERLKQKYKDQDLFLDVFDISGLLTQVYNNPEEYGFSKEKLTTPFISSEEFRQDAADPVDQVKHISPADGYMFWDDVHPTATMHAWLAEKYMAKYDQEFTFRSPTTHAAEHHVKKNNKRVEDKYGLDVSEQLTMHGHIHRAFPNPSSKAIIDTLINKIKHHQQGLKTSCTTVGKEKANALNALVLEIDKAWSGRDLETLNKVLNEGVNNLTFAVHRNPRWDKFWQKETTHTEDILRNLQLAVNDALNLPTQEAQDSFKL